MLKSLYIITILSVVLIYSQTSFSQSMKKELGICGKTFNTVLKISPKADPGFSNSFVTAAEFCDNGRYEQGANFIISLYNAKDQLIYDKRIFLNTLNFQEGHDIKSGAFKKTRIVEGSNSRILKFPVSAEMGEVTSYKIESLEAKKTYPKKKIKW
ncbi:MAG: hypothetical protein H7336_12060 [Bacteriovorax sp.]|nr:hypothetical protein [Bacteriovorax sp.]